MIKDKKSIGSQIAGSIRMCMYLACGVKDNKYKQPKFLENCAEDSVYYRLTDMLDKGLFNDAENLMYELLSPTKPEDYYTMLCVYEYMNDFDDDFLENNEFSREEVLDGIRAITDSYDTEGIFSVLM